MRTRSLLLCVFMYLLSVSLQAQEVVVYKGTARIQRGDATSLVNNAYTAYVIFDFDTLAGRIVLVSSRARTVFDIGARSYGIAEVGTTRATTTYLTHGSGAFTNARNFTNLYTRFSGRRTTLSLQGITNPGNIANLPKSMTGIISDTLGTPVTFVGTFAVAFDAKRTQAANNFPGFKNPSVVSAEIRAEFTNRGFTDTTNP
jgi:hypothetical protein